MAIPGIVKMYLNLEKLLLFPHIYLRKTLMYDSNVNNVLYLNCKIMVPGTITDMLNKVMHCYSYPYGRDVKL